MKQIRIGIICPSEIAVRRFLPALTLIDDVVFVGVAVNTEQERYGNNMPPTDEIQSMLQRTNRKANEIVNTYGGIVFDSFSSIISSSEIDAIYIPLPPALHYKWADKALKKGKHVIIEKPATLSLETTDSLITTARKLKLAFHENYMFVFHNQLDEIKKIVDSGEIGDVRLYRISFGFPMRGINDFRYSSILGGGALYDAGGYTIKCASYLLGDTTKVVYSFLNSINGFDVDMFGSGVLVNDQGVTAQVAFGMDNDYRCELEVWGSRGTLTTGRILTAPPDYEPIVTIVKNGQKELIKLSKDNSFRKSIEKFISCVDSDIEREKNYNTIHRQAELVQSFWNYSCNQKNSFSYK